MWRRVLREFDHHDQRGNPLHLMPGQLVDILRGDDDARLMALGMVGPREISMAGDGPPGQPARPYAMTRRCGIWLQTTSYYSGGRIHLYQYAWSMAANGWEVYLVTNAHPRWSADFPSSPRLRVLLAGKDAVPPDLDLIVTDSKGAMGKLALRHKRRHPRVPFVCFNFETPNWVEKFAPKYAEKLHQDTDVFKEADYLISNSIESDKYLREWIAKPIPSGVLNPAINEFAITAASSNTQHARPYFVWSSRQADYKGGALVADAVHAISGDADLVVFGNGAPGMPTTVKHRLILKQAASEAEKLSWMKGAVAVLAPSLFEGYGMVPGESIAVGTPCIVYDLPVLRQAYGDRLTYVPWNDAKAFKAAVLSAYQKRERVLPAVVEGIRNEKSLDSMRKHVERLPYHAIKRPSVSVHCIVYWGYIPESIESIYPFVDEIIVAYGPTKHSVGLPDDGSLERLQATPDPDKKIKIEVRSEWADKEEKRSWATRNLRGNWHMMLDGDEVWVGLGEWIAGRNGFGCPRWVNLWHGAQFWIHDSPKLAGLRWGKRLPPLGSVCPHYRWSWWRASYVWMRHPVLTDHQGNALHLPNNPEVMAQTPESVIYHLGHSLPAQVMRAKHKFYRVRDGDNAGRRERERVWHEWNGKAGETADGIISPVDWPLPEIVQRAVKSAAAIEVKNA